MAVKPEPRVERNAAGEAQLVSVPVAVAVPAWMEKVIETLPSFTFILRFGWRLWQRWGTDRCAIVAAALAFFGLISIFPVVMAAVAILSRALAGTPETLESFHVFVANFFPGAAGEITRQLDAVSDASNPATLSAIAVVSLLWCGRAYFATLTSVFDSIWPNASPRAFWRNQLALSALFVGAGLLWVLSTMATFTLKTLQAAARSSPQLAINQSPLVWDLAGKLVSFALTTWMFWLLYRFLPNVQNRRRRLLVWGASAVGGIGWESAKWLFTVVIGANIGRYHAMYGSAAGIVLTMLWFYVSSCILLLGAEAAAVYEEMDAASAEGLWRKRRKGEP